MWEERVRVLPPIPEELNSTQYFCQDTPQIDETTVIHHQCTYDRAKQFQK